MAATPEVYGVSPEQAAELVQKQAEYAQAYWQANQPSLRTATVVVQKNLAREALLRAVRLVVAVVGAANLADDAARTELGISDRQTARVIGRPTDVPRLIASRIDGHRVTLRLLSDRRRKARPIGTAAASIFTHAGEEPPKDRVGWLSRGWSIRTTVELDFTGSMSAQTIWVTSAWVSPRGEEGRYCRPLAIELPRSQRLPTSSRSEAA